MRAYCHKIKDCWDYVEELSKAGIPSVLSLSESPRNIELADHILPKNKAPILRMQTGGVGIELVEAWWSFVSRKRPGSLNDRPESVAFTARAETVASSRTFKEAFAERRCLVPAQAWYEWTGRRARRTMWEFMPKGGGTAFFAGLWETFDNPKAGQIDTFTIITEPAGSPLNAYHNRAPVVLWGCDRNLWLNPRTPCRELQELLGPESPDGFDVRRVSGLGVENIRVKKKRRGKLTLPAKIGTATRSATLLLAKVLELEALGRVLEAACYRRDIEKMIERCPALSRILANANLGPRRRSDWSEQDRASPVMSLVPKL